MRSIVWLGLAASACFAPSPQSGAPCIPAAGNCPSGQSCVANDTGFVCSAGGETAGPDASSDPPPDGSIDAAATFCFGTGLVRDVCFTEAPSGTLSIAAATTIDTATVGPGNCSEIRAQPGGPSLCLIANQAIEIKSGVTLRGIGPNPLVLIAGSTLTIDGTLDVASKRAAAIGAGSRAMCGVGLAGTNGANQQGGGGGAGGSFGRLGADGGVGDEMTPAGKATATPPPVVVIGGCPGGNGGAGAGGGGVGLGGAGGGAVYLIAQSIAIAGTINASGAAGVGGTAGVDSSGGGGGGGAGGLIGLDAPMVAITGSVFANGGGGGGGGGDDPSNPGVPGNDPNAANAAANGGNGGGGGGGRGGAGFGGPNNPQVGNGTASTFCAGGGGGGGAGVVKLFQATLPGGTVSPPPS